MKRRILLIATFAIALSGAADARPGDRLRAWFAQRAAANEGNAPEVPVATTIAYGSDPAQSLDFWAAHLPSDPAMVPADIETNCSNSEAAGDSETSNASKLTIQLPGSTTLGMGCTGPDAPSTITAPFPTGLSANPGPP